VTLEWSIQHACGPNDNCELIVQYYCDDNITRDGLTTDRIPDPETPEDAVTECFESNCDMDPMYGRHESWESYKQCKYRERNRGLWTSAEDMRNRNGAIYTRQNNNGDRRGYECPEERDYYPYWHPTIWRDIAILTSDTSRCAAYQAESQNVKKRSYCKVSQEFIDQQLNGATWRRGFIAIEPNKCKQIGGEWVDVEPFNIPAPKCDKHPITRDNHHGNPVGSAFWPRWNWTIPGEVQLESCVLRLRYNMSSSETRAFGEWNADKAECGALNSTWNYKEQQGAQVDDDSETGFRYAARMPLWTKYKINYNEIDANLDYNLFQISTVKRKRGYVLGNDPLVDIFGDTAELGGKTVQLRLAVDTNQFSRTFEDRTHVFAIRPAPTVLEGMKIHHLGVRGKRGNIVQVYPSVEYDFTPEELYVSKGEFIHFQWTGSNTNPNNNAGQGTQGTDRSNVILLRHMPPEYQVDAQLKGPHEGHTGAYRQSYPSRVDDASPTANFLGLTQSQKTALARAGIYTPHVDIGPLQVLDQGIFNYICTRNNAFTNRDQKGRLVVGETVGGAEAFKVIDTSSMFSQLISSNGNAWLRFYPDPIGLTTGSQLRIEMEGDRVHVTPLLFDVVPGQKILLEIKYPERPLQEIYIMQSDYADEMIVYEMDTESSGGIAGVEISRGGYYWVDQRTSVGSVVGIVVGVVIAVGGFGGLYWKLRKTFAYGGKKAHLMDGAGETNTA